MTIREVKELYRGEYADIEVYVPTSFRCSDPFHTDAVRGTDDYSDDSEVITYSNKDKEDYISSLYANCDMPWKWEDCFNPEDRILCILIKAED